MCGCVVRGNRTIDHNLLEYIVTLFRMNAFYQSLSLPISHLSDLWLSVESRACALHATRKSAHLKILRTHNLRI